MRDAIDAYVERGGHVARFAGNFMWQTRLERGGKAQVCYKYRARAEDPVYRSADPSRTTGSWEAREIGRPGALTFGLNATNGLYAGWGGCAPRGVRGFPVYRPEHWAFAGTGLYYGDLLGADGHAFGYEVDGLDYVIRGGLPEPSDTSGAPQGLQILALGMSSLKEERDRPRRSTIDSCPTRMRNSSPRSWLGDGRRRRRRAGQARRRHDRELRPRQRRGVSRGQLRMGGGARAARRDGRDVSPPTCSRRYLGR